jgi:hypothetical protein
MRALTRANSSASWRFFLRSASRAACCTAVTECVEDCDSGVVVAFCLPLAVEEDVETGTDTDGVGRKGATGSNAPYKSSSASLGVIDWAGSGVVAGGVITCAALEPGMGLAPRTFRTALMKSLWVTSLLSCTCSRPFCMTMKVGMLSIAQNAPRKPASVDPASMRRRIAFWTRRLDIWSC